MKTNKLHEGICGIYCIQNITNDKKYIGKSINVRQRIYCHIGGLNAKDPKRENVHFINAWWKYGSSNFEYYILEIIDKNIENLENIVKEKELFWIDYYKTTDRNKGYNLRMDSDTKMLVHEETRKKYSEAQKKRYNNLEERNKIGKRSSNFWKNNPDIKKEMAEKVSDKHTRYFIHEYCKKTNILIKVWNKAKDIINDNPNYKIHNIYACCSGRKPSMYGFKWVKVLKGDIVQTI